VGVTVNRSGVYQQRISRSLNLCDCICCGLGKMALAHAWPRPRSRIGVGRLKGNSDFAAGLSAVAAITPEWSANRKLSGFDGGISPVKSASVE
jgi:hypothetical protein